jgi:Cu2+-exporting ATPase
MGGGTDLAHTSADMVLLADDIGRLAAACAKSREAMRIIRQNLAWAAVYNAVAIPLAAAGWVTPLVAGVGMAVSSLAVVMNALRLQGRRVDAASLVSAAHPLTPVPLPSGEGRIEIPFSPWEKGMG